MNLEINTTITYTNQDNSPTRVTHHIGGTRSGKTYALLQWCIVKALEKKEIITIVRKTLPSAKRTVMKDFKDVMQLLDIWNENDFNISDRIYSFYTNSTISFISTDDNSFSKKERHILVISEILFCDNFNKIELHSILTPSTIISLFEAGFILSTVATSSDVKTSVLFHKSESKLSTRSKLLNCDF